MTHPDKCSRPGLEGTPKHRQILAGAREVFAELGYERASVDQIAARAGVSKATVYNHFQDKKTLFVACFSEEADTLRAGVRCKLMRSEPTGAVGPALLTLCHGDLHSRAQFGILPEPLAPTIKATVERGVAVFLASYAARREDHR